MIADEVEVYSDRLGKKYQSIHKGEAICLNSLG